MSKKFMTSAERKEAAVQTKAASHTLGRKWKIITFETETGDRLPIIFPAALTHRHLGKEIEARAEYLGLDEEELHNAVEIANRLTAMDHGKSWRSLKPVSAGFVSGLRVDAVHGESETLELKADPMDKKFINQCES